MKNIKCYLSLHKLPLLDQVNLSPEHKEETRTRKCIRCDHEETWLFRLEEFLTIYRVKGDKKYIYYLPLKAIKHDR